MLLAFAYLVFLAVLLVGRRRREFATDVALPIARSSRRSPGYSRPDAGTG
jgi:hypothetical protein